jgi:thymidylate kinase
VELDLVTEFAFGPRCELRPAAAAACLARRRRSADGWALSAGDEFWALLLHCLLDKRTAPEHHLCRLKELEGLASLESPLAQALPPRVGAARLLEQARAGEWSALAERRRALRAAWWRAHPADTAGRSACSAALRLVERPMQAWDRRGASVAVIGPDGAGKSTLAAGLAGAFYFPVRSVYMGLWPANDAASGPLRVLLRPLTVWRRYLGALRHRALGRLVVFDRYGYDALLSPRGGWPRLKRAYFAVLARLCPAPDVVLLLDAPGPVLHARSGEYDPARLEADRAEYRLLRGRVPDLVQLDARRPAEAVLADAVDRIWRHYRTRTARKTARNTAGTPR